jgi:FtsP/CotA-like multicopper oxidase with cupredoxin domain
VSGTPSDTIADNSVPEGDQLMGRVFDVPTNSSPSPLFGAEAFTQQMLRFEEFGAEKLRLKKKRKKNKRPKNWSPLPEPSDAQGSPDSEALDDFLAQDIWPLPTAFANDRDMNPWQSQIEDWVGRSLDTPPAEGRPPGLAWSHQRWKEFYPKAYYQTATTGARTNRGLRDEKQSHGYETGEFGEDGLYYNTTGKAGSEGTTAGIPVKFHPDMPMQKASAVWTFDGTFPPKLLKARYGEPVLMRHYNALPIDVAENRGFGVHTLTTHEHNGHNPAESDGFANAFFFPGQFYDYRWTLALAGGDSINSKAKDKRAGRPDGKGGIKKIPGDWRETMSTHWFHDHMLDYTAQNVYKGSVAMMNYYSALDRGNESINDGVNLRLPSGSGLDWGNRDYDVNLLLAEKAWDAEGQLWFNPFNQKGFIGDVMTVNWLYKPYFEVRARRYRFRILNGSVSRYFKVALVNEAGDPVPFHMVANDGNIMEHSVHFPNGELPTIGIAERYDIIIDFSQFEPGSKLYLVNMLQHKNGQVTDVPIPLADIVSGVYQATAVDDDFDGKADRWVDGDPVVGKFLEFRVREYEEKDQSLEPSKYVAGGKKMIPLRRPSEEELENAIHRSFEFEREPTDDRPWVIETDGGKGFGADPRRLSAAPEKNSGGLEVWRLLNSGTWSHPIHIHFEEGIILRRDGKEPPEWEKWARKDVYRLGPQEDSGVMVEIALRFREFAGTYMEHCHNTQHEDHAMLLRWDIEHPGQTELMATPLPSWDGVTYVDTHALPTFRTGEGIGEYGPLLEPISVWVDDATVGQLDGIRDMPLGDAFDPQPNERGTITFPLMRGTNNDDGVLTDVWYFLHDISDEHLAEEMGLAWGGALVGTPEAATAAASIDPVTGHWTFEGDLPNPVWALPGCRVSDGIDPASGKACENPDGIPNIDSFNTYSPLRRVVIDGKEVIVNAIMVKWGSESWEHHRIDESCVSFPEIPWSNPKTCAYVGAEWGALHASGQVLALDTDGPDPYVTFKLHKAWADGADYLPYYIVLDTFASKFDPALGEWVPNDGPAKAMGVPFVPKHEYLGSAGIPLVQFLPPESLYPGSTPANPLGFGLHGGGPLGGQVGVPAYFMPEDEYSPMWHIGFARWLEPATEVVKGFERLKQLRAEGKLEILEFPPPPHFGSVEGDHGYFNFDHQNSKGNARHIVNCPTTMTIDAAVHQARQLDQPPLP